MVINNYPSKWVCIKMTFQSNSLFQKYKFISILFSAVVKAEVDNSSNDSSLHLNKYLYDKDMLE